MKRGVTSDVVVPDLCMGFPCLDTRTWEWQNGHRRRQ